MLHASLRHWIVPIINTALAWILGMRPLALGIHAGSGRKAPITHALAGGLISSIVLPLVVVPVAPVSVDSFGRRARRWFRTDPDHGHPTPR